MTEHAKTVDRPSIKSQAGSFIFSVALVGRGWCGEVGDTAEPRRPGCAAPTVENIVIDAAALADWPTPARNPCL